MKPKLMLVVLGGLVAAAAVMNLRRGRPAARRGLRRGERRIGLWTFDQQFRVMPTRQNLRVELTSPAIVHWTVDQWDTAHDTRTTEQRGVHWAELPTSALPSGTRLQFTFFWPEVNRWEGEDFEVRLEEGAALYAS